MKKKFLLFILLAIFIIVGTYRVKYFGDIDKLQKGIASEIIRFHVRANSDSDEDQELKLKVKDAVVDYIKPKLNGSQSLDESRQILNNEIDNIKQVAIDTLRANNSDYQVSVYFEKAYFPVKSYGDVTFPPGEYEAFRIDIGESEGRNWWCVLYPPLCFVDAVYGVVPQESKNQLANVLSEDEYRAVTNTNNKIKFKYLTFLNSWFGL